MVELLRLVDDDVAPSISEMKSEKQRKACVVWGFKSSLCTQRYQPIRAVRKNACGKYCVLSDRPLFRTKSMLACTLMSFCMVNCMFA